VSWFYLILAGLLEIVWASTLKQTQGFTRLGPSIFTAVLYFVSLYFLSLGLRDLPASSGYALWVGIGAVGTALVGILFLGEPKSALRLISIALIVLGVIGLRLAERG